MEILRTCVDEISLSGLKGCTVEELWDHLETRKPPIPFKLDNYIKQFAWKHIVKLAKKSQTIHLYKLPSPRERKQTTFCFSVGSSIQWTDYKHPFPYRPINDTTKGERGSSPHYSERVEVTDEVEEEQMDLARVTESYGNCLVLVANQELRDRALSPLTQVAPVDLTDIQFGLLEVVGCSRHYGISRPDVTSKYLKIDARSVYHHTKTLRQHGLVVVKAERRCSLPNRSNVIHVIYLSRFAPLHSPSTSFEEYFCSILAGAPNWTMSLDQLKEKLGRKQVKATKAVLVRKGFVQTVDLGDVSKEFANDPEKASVKCVQLIKPFKESEAGDGSEGGEEEDEEAAVDTNNVAVVTELPLITQGYRLIDSYGPDGMSNMDFCFNRGLGLDPYINRLISRTLIKQTKVFAITLDNPPIRTIMLVSDRHVQANKEYVRLHKEKERSGSSKVEVAVVTGENYMKEKRVKKEVMIDEEPGPSGVGVVPLISFPDDMELPLPRQQVEGQDEEVAAALQNQLCKSDEVDRQSIASEIDWSTPASSTGTPVPESELASSNLISQSPNPDSRVMTYHKLRRCNLIMEYIAEHRVIQGCADLARHLRDIEKDDGRSVTMDLKTVRKLLRQLEQDHRLFHLDDVLEAHLDADTVVSSQPVTFWCALDVSEEEIKVVKEKAMQSFYCVVQRRTLGSRTKKIKKAGKESSDEEEESEEEGEDGGTDEGYVPKVTITAKFQRLRHLHYYLWILVYGRGSCWQKEEGEGEGGEEMEDSERESAVKRERLYESILPETNFPWAKAVRKLPLSSKGRGWIEFTQLHNHMPLSLWLVMMKMYSGSALGKLPAKYSQYFEDSELNNKLLHQLPRKLRKSFVHAGRDMIHISEFLKQLEEMELVVVEGDYSSKNKTNMTVYLNRTVSFLDTSKAQPRYSFFTNEARELFKSISFVFESLADVERYWFQLQSTCQKTPIILKDHPVQKDDELAQEDNFALPYSARMSLHRTKDAQYNSKGFGAAGLPPLTFSHLSRNWRVTQQNKKPLGWDGNQSVALSTSSLVGGASYMPGEGLFNLPNIAMTTDGDLDESEVRVHGEEMEEEMRDLPPAKLVRLMAGESIVPSSQVKRNEGGRGRERIRKRKTAAVRKLKTSELQPSSSRYRYAQAVSASIIDAPDSQVTERETLTMTIPERAYWYPKEDSFLLLTYLTSAVIKELSLPLVTFNVVQEAFRREFPSSKYKTVDAIKRRLHSLVKKKAELAAYLHIFISETVHEMNTLGEDCPELSFEPILAFVRKKYYSQDGSITLPQVLLLPPTLRQLYDEYEVVGGPESKPSYLVPADTDSEVNQALLANLILATVGSNESSFDQYKAYKLFESFPESDMEESFDQLRRRYLIKLKRTVVGIRRRQGPNTTVSYTLSANFFSRLERHYLMSHLQHHEEFMEAFNAQLQPSCDDHMISDPAVSLVDGGVMRIEADKAKNGTTAAVVDTIITGKNLVSCSTEFPEPLFEPGNEEALEAIEGEMMEGDEEGALREDHSQSARQLVKTALKEAERETNSDEEDMMELGGRGGGGDGGSVDDGAAGGSQALTGAVKYGGINSLFNFGAGVLRYGPIDVVPGFSIGKLLDPIPEPESTIPSSLEHHLSASYLFDGDSHPSSPIATEGVEASKALSLEAYLDLIKSKLGFSDCDVEFARRLLEVIATSGKFGIARDLLSQHSSLHGAAHQVNLETHLQTLLNFEMIHRFGINKEHFVSHSNSNFWSMTPDDVIKGDVPFVSYQPWSSVGNSDPNSSMLTGISRGVLNYIMASPGVTQDTLGVHFSGLLQPNGLQQVLSVLEVSGYVKRHTLHQRTVKCFASQSTESSSSKTVNYYEPIL